MRKLALTDDILMKIEKPARYIGNEVNSVMKDKTKVDPVCHVFPGCVRDWNVTSWNPDSLCYV